MNGRRLLVPLAAAPVAYALARAAVARKVAGYENLDADAADDLPGVRLYLRGRRVHVRIEGEGPALLMIHGFGASSAAFARLAPLLRRRMTLIMPDLPGFGYSERSPDADHSHQANAELLLDLLDHLEVGRAAVLGHSVGAAVALRIAATATERVAALILASGPSRDPALPRWMEPILALAAPPLVESRRAQRWLNQAAMAPAGRVDEATIASYHREARVRGHAATLVAMLARTRFGPAPNLQVLRSPILIMTGESDRYFPPTRARTLAEELPAAGVSIIEDAAHLALEEQAEAAAGAMLRFLDDAGVLLALRRDGAVPRDIAEPGVAGG
jgi:magnesium chelatase accessory protein